MAKIQGEVRDAAISADIDRFPGGVDYEYWFNFPALTVEELVALSCDREPEILNPKRIDEFKLPTPHPRLVRTRQDLMGMSAIAIEYKPRRNFLLRACRRRDLEATLVGDTYEISWDDFFPWLDRQRGKDPWDLLPDAFEQRLKEFRDAKHTGKEKAARSSPAAAGDKADLAALDMLKDKKGCPLKDKKNVPEAWELILSTLRTPLDMRIEYPTMKALRTHCEDKLGIKFHDCLILVREAKKQPGTIPYPDGAPSKSRRNQ
jgi:hypothetical protein